MIRVINPGAMVYDDADVSDDRALHDHSVTDEDAMIAIRRLSMIAAFAMLSACASNTIAPTYTSTNPDIMRIGGEQPENPAPTSENLGSFCVETTDIWKEHGQTPDGQKLWAKDTQRSVIPCQP